MDIDIDVADNKKARSVLRCTRASIVENDELKPHLVGLYFQKIPVDSITGLAAIPYETAEELDFLKVDILNLSFLEHFNSKHEIRKLLKRQPKWNLLVQDDVIPKLFHLSNHGDTLKRVKPTTIEELADVLALIRPNKKALISKYISNRVATRKELYKKEVNSDLRKSHAIPYAQIIVLQLHLIEAGII